MCTKCIGGVHPSCNRPLVHLEVLESQGDYHLSLDFTQVLRIVDVQEVKVYFAHQPLLFLSNFYLLSRNLTFSSLLCRPEELTLLLNDKDAYNSFLHSLDEVKRLDMVLKIMSQSLQIRTQDSFVQPVNHWRTSWENRIADR